MSLRAQEQQQQQQQIHQPQQGQRRLEPDFQVFPNKMTASDHDEIRPSAVQILIHNNNNNNNNNNSNEEQVLRFGHIATLWPLTSEDDPRTLNLEFIYYVASAYMALEHFNARNGAIVPALTPLLQDCNFYLTMQIRDTRFNAFQAVTQLTRATVVNKTKPDLRPFAMVGPALSGETLTSSILASALQIPQISGTATSKTLNYVPLFARTIVTNQGDARAIMMYLQSIHVTKIGILYVRDAWGNSYNLALAEAAKEYDIDIALVAPYTDDDWDNLGKAMKALAGSKLRYFVAAINQDNWKPVVRMAYQYGIMGQYTHVWHIAEFTEIVGAGFELKRETESDIAAALHGTGIVLLYMEDNPVFDQALQDFLLERDTPDPTTNRTMRQRFITAHEESELFRDVAFEPPNLSIYDYLMYDSVMALGLAACHTPGNFTSNEFYNTLLNTTFEGVTGFVSFDPVTGTRDAETVKFQLLNLILSDEGSTATTIKFRSQRSVILGDGNITVLAPFVFHDNTTTPPPQLPPVENINYNLIPQEALIYGWVFTCLVMSSSVGWMIWTIVNREKFVVKASQPVFLCQLCIGTFLMALCVFPMGLQEEPDGTARYNLDFACNAAAWLFFVGFVISFSALFSKAWRLNKLLQSSNGMQRIELRPRHVIGPFIVFMVLNVGLLLGMTLVSPFTWTRVESTSNVDKFGRPVESYGTCKPQANDNKTIFYFLVPLVLVNVMCLVFAAYQTYQARHLPTEFSESSYLSVAMISLLEVVLIGLPILFSVSANPTAAFVVDSSLVNIACICILLPMFGPKYARRHAKPKGARAGPILAGNRPKSTSTTTTSNLAKGDMAILARKNPNE